MIQQSTLAKPTVKYSLGPYNKSDEDEQWIRITEGCPNNCPYCYEPTEFKVFDIPEIIRNDVKVMDMNLLAKPEAQGIIKELGKKRVNKKVVHYELICGIDYRFMSQDTANLLNPRLWSSWAKRSLSIPAVTRSRACPALSV